MDERGKGSCAGGGEGEVRGLDLNPKALMWAWKGRVKRQPGTTGGGPWVASQGSCLLFGHKLEGSQSF